MKPAILAGLTAAVFSGSSFAQGPACDAPAVVRKLKEDFYVQVFTQGRFARAQRLADPFRDSPETFAPGIEAAASKLQAEIRVRGIINQGYREDLNVRICLATMLVADNQSLAVASRYLVRNGPDGMPVVAGEFELPGGGGATSFNALMILFGHFYAVAFPAVADASSSQPATAPSAPAPRMTFAEADKQLNDAYKAAMARLSADGKVRLRNEQRSWISFRDSTCKKFAAPDAAICATGITVERIKDLSSIANGK